jgi:Mrp family chromosome partitioning ATPase/uncharacterized protein involved in exopolysaccharide biosynthesis
LTNEIKPVSSPTQGLADSGLLERRWQTPMPAVIRILRYRARWIIILGILGAVLGGAIGRRFGQRRYQSEALVRIPYARQGMDSHDGDAMPMELFEAFLQSQMAVLNSRRLVVLALAQPSWKAIGGNASPEMLEEFAGRLSIDHTPQTDYLLISYTDTHPEVCAAAVQSLTAAYSQVYDSESQAYLKQRTAELQARRNELSNKIAEFDLQISAAAGSAGTANADHLYDAAVQRFTNMETLVAQARVELATAEGERGQVGRTAQNIDALEAQIASLNELCDQSKQEMTALGQKRLEMDRLRTAKEPIEKELEETDQGIDALQFESGIGGRLVVVTAGETPLAPSDDKKMSYTVRGATAGALFPGAVIILLGFISTRYKSWGEAEADVIRDAPLLGVVPVISNGTGDQTKQDAARCVHQTRTVLNDRFNLNTGSKIFLVTSCTAGEGKTSLAVSLGLSFASTGLRTLLIDCDLLAHSLTRGFSYSGVNGLKEALASGKLAPYCSRSAQSSLWVLPVGQSTSADAGALSPARIDAMLKQARHYFHVIIIDSGPILGSVEAMTMASRVDAVIFTIARHQQRLLIETAIRKLHSLGATLAGTVFNRAVVRDFHHSAYYSAYKGVDSLSKANEAAIQTAIANRLTTEPGGFGGFGPLVAAVAASVPVNNLIVKSSLAAS